MTNQKKSKSDELLYNQFELHKAVYNGNVEQVKDILTLEKYDINRKDKFGNTPLHLASMLGHTECVSVLTEHHADPNIKNEQGWTPLAEVVSYGNRESIKTVLKQMKNTNKKTMDERKPKLIEKLKELNDFQVELKWEFHSWVPLISRLLPSDTCTITKKGASIRMDSTLIEFTDMKWQRGDISFLFNGCKEGSDSLVVLDNEKGVFQKLQRKEHENELEDEVNYLMSSDIVTAQMSTKPIMFTPAQAGWIFREDKCEMVSQMSCQVYNVQGMTLASRKRREHLSEEDLQKNKAMIDAFKRGDSMLMENEKCQPLPKKESLSPPESSPYSWEDYSKMENAPFIGRPIKLTEQKKTLKASVWMSQDFPLTIELLLSVLHVIAPSKHFLKIKEFVSMKLPPGFPVKLEVPMLPTIVARVTFQEFSWMDDIPDSYFQIPENFREDPHHFPDL